MMTSSMSMIVQLLLSIHLIDSSTIEECADFQECAPSANIQKGKIICSGERSCEDAQSLKAKTNVICSGSRSCRDALNLETEAKVGKVFCNGYDSCSDSVFSDTTSIIVHCDGEQGCMQSQPLSDNTLPAKRIYCNGRASCWKRTLNTETETLCNGEAACNATTINAGGKVHCDSNRACSSSIITTSPTKIVQCDGYRSCWDAVVNRAKAVRIYGVAAADFIDIVNVEKIEAYSGFTLSQATIDSGSLSEMTVELFGVSLDTYFESTSIICRSGAQCLLVCKDNGCADLKYYCDDGATCKMRPAKCKKTEEMTINGRDCPTIINGPIPAELTLRRTQKETDYNYDVNMIETDINTDSNRGTYTICDQESMCENMRIEDKADGIKCSGSSSCTLSTLKTAKKESIIYCSGDKSCSDAARIDATGMLYCHGSQSCQGATIHTVGDLQCLGALSCHDTVLKMEQSKLDSSLECGSYRSCSGVDIPKSSAPFYDVECNGYESCLGSKFEAENSIFCEGCKSCLQSKLVSESNIQCLGSYSCSKSTLNLREYIYLKGAYAAHESYITYGNIKMSKDHSDVPIKAEGFKSLDGAVIDSGDSTAIKIQLLGQLAGNDAIIICRDRCDCEIVCHTTACVKLTVMCQTGSNCNVRPVGCDGTVPNFEGVGCPDVQTDVAAPQISDILQQKQAEREGGGGSLIMEYDYEYDANYKQLNVVIGGDDEKVMLLTNIESSLVLMVGVLCVIGLVYLWYKQKYIEYTPLK